MEFVTDIIANDPIQLLTKKLFMLHDASLFTQIVSSLDPRGYVDLYGSDFEKEYKLQDGKYSFKYKTLTCFFDHISFISGHLDCILFPDQTGINITLCDTNTDQILVTEKFNNCDQFIKLLSSLIATLEIDTKAEA